jgi:hypothetical protein
MGLINIWRIPLLFIISGMGVCFAMRRRNWKELLKDRTRRILLPLIFGSLFIVPVHGYLYQSFMGLDHIYFPNPGHLWFLSNIFIYVLVLCPVFFYLKRNPDNILLRLFKRVLKFPATLYLVTIPFIFEAALLAYASNLCSGVTNSAASKINGMVTRYSVAGNFNTRLNSLSKMLSGFLFR